MLRYFPAPAVDFRRSPCARLQSCALFRFCVYQYMYRLIWNQSEFRLSVEVSVPDEASASIALLQCGLVLI